MEMVVRKARGCSEVSAQSRESRTARTQNTNIHKTRDPHADRLDLHADRHNTHPHNKHPPLHTQHTRNRIDRTDLDSDSIRYMTRQGYDRADHDNELAQTHDSHQTQMDRRNKHTQ